MASRENITPAGLGIGGSPKPADDSESFSPTVGPRCPLTYLGTAAPNLELGDLMALSDSRTCAQARTFLTDCTERLAQFHQPRNLPFATDSQAEARINLSGAAQYGDLVLIPRTKGRAIVVSDIEGDLELVKEIFRKERILETLERRPLDEQVFFICLGDMIDRKGNRASEIIEFLLDLKFNRGFESNIHLLAGNHELSPSMQKGERAGGFFKEVVECRRSYSIEGGSNPELERDTAAWFKERFLTDIPGDVAPARVALWRQFNELFTQLPKTVLIGNGLVLCHGGLTDAGPFRYVHDPAEFIKPSFEMAVEWLTSMPFRTDELTSEEREIYDDLHRLSVEDITWSDWGPNMPSTEPNMTRARDKDGNPTPLGLYFGSDALGRYLDILGAQVMIRGHQKWIPGADKLSNGVWCAGDSLLTINSSTPVSKFVKDKHGSFREVAVWAPNYLEIDLSAPVRSARDITVHMI